MSRAHLYCLLPFAVPFDCSLLCFVAFLKFKFQLENPVLFSSLFFSSFVSLLVCVCAWNYCNFGRQVCVVFVCPSFPTCLQSVELSSFMHSLFQLPSPDRVDQPERSIACSGDTCLISSFRLWPHILRAGAVEVEAMLNYASLALRPLPDFYLSSFSKAALAFLWNVLGARWTSSRTRRTKDDEKNTKRNEVKNKPNRSHWECSKYNNKTKPSREDLKICHSRISILKYAAGLECFNISKTKKKTTKNIKNNKVSGSLKYAS